MQIAFFHRRSSLNCRRVENRYEMLVKATDDVERRPWSENYETGINVYFNLGKKKIVWVQILN